MTGAPAPRITSLFATPVYTVMLPGVGPLNQALAHAITQRRGAATTAQLSNVGGWQSGSDMLAWGGPAARALADQACALSSHITALADGRPAGNVWRPEMWANINEDGHSNQSHWHPGSFLSFVYYVDDGYAGSPDRQLGGELVFVDPRMPFIHMRTPDLRYVGADGDADEQETWVRPVAGLLIGFPSFLAHSVRPYRGRGRRISIAINMVVAGAGAAR